MVVVWFLRVEGKVYRNSSVGMKKWRKEEFVGEERFGLEMVE